MLCSWLYNVYDFIFQAHICTVALLVELGAKINVQQDTGETALMKVGGFLCNYNSLRVFSLDITFSFLNMEKKVKSEYLYFCI